METNNNIAEAIEAALTKRNFNKMANIGGICMRYNNTKYGINIVAIINDIIHVASGILLSSKESKIMTTLMFETHTLADKDVFDKIEKTCKHLHKPPKN